jgi:hypothetical protein
MEVVMAELIHKFEAAGLGKAPFRFVGVVEKTFKNGDGTEKAGSSCDYCSTGIRYEFWCVSSDNRKFKVGCDCIYKIEATTKLRSDVEKAELRVKKANQQARDAERIANAKAKLAANADLLANQPHPVDYLAKQGKTMRNYAEWLLANGGNAGRIRAAKMIDRA